MRVLITGVAGFIGSHLCERFLKEGFYVIGMDNFLTGSPDNIAHLFGNKNFHFTTTGGGFTCSSLLFSHSFRPK